MDKAGGVSEVKWGSGGVVGEECRPEGEGERCGVAVRGEEGEGTVALLLNWRFILLVNLSSRQQRDHIVHIAAF